MKRTDLIIIAGLILAVLVFLLPMLNGWLGIICDDTYETFPRVFSNARSLQQGALPLWNPYFFAGGRINYVPNTRIWYWPLYPFYFFASLNNPDSAFAGLVKFPLLAHWLICVLTAYGLGRMAIKLGRTAALVLSVVYGFGVMMSGNISAIEGIYSATWIPLAIWGIVSFAGRRQRIMGILGALAIAFIGPCGTDVRAVFSLVTVALTIGLVAAFSLLYRSPAKARRILVAGLIIFILGLLLSGPYWVAMKETVAIYRDSTMVSFSRAASAESSTPWSFLITLLVPDFFGTVTAGSSVNFGLPEIRSFWHVEGNLTGGYWLLLLCFLGSVAFWRNHYKSGSDKTDRTRMVWWWVSLSLFVFSLLLITGRYSPLYRWLVRIIPVFGLPYAVRWRIMEHLGIALLAGISSQALIDNRRSLSRCLPAALVVLTLAGVAWQFQRTGSHGLPVLQHVWENHRTWLIFSTGIYLAWVLGGTTILIFLAGRSWRGKFVIAAVVLESVLIGFLMTYFLAFRSSDIGDTRYRSPCDTALYRQSDHPFLSNLPPPRTGQERTTFYNSMVDHMAILHGGHYLTGYCSKPIAPRLKAALAEVIYGYPYELIIEKPAARFFPNMSVRYIVLQSPDMIPPELAEIQTLPGLSDEAKLYSYRLKDTLPRVFTQDRVVVCSPEEALNELLNGNLRKATFIEDGNQVPVTSDRSLTSVEEQTDNGPLIEYYQSYDPGSEEEVIRHFNELQQLNRISAVRFPTPSRMEIDIEVKVSALLVTTDIFYPGWEVLIDGKAAVPLPVNYLQRGVWLPEGPHLVEWIFRPTLLHWGWVALGLGILGIAGMVIYPRKKRHSPPPAKFPKLL